MNINAGQKEFKLALKDLYQAHKINPKESIIIQEINRVINHINIIREDVNKNFKGMFLRKSSKKSAGSKS